MRDVGIDNKRIYEKYQLITEAKNGMRRQVQLLEDKIDEFMDKIEKKIDSIDDNPVFQRKMYQMRADTQKEHDEFIMALKRLASTLDSGAKVIPQTKGGAKNPNQMQDEEPEKTGEENEESTE